MTVRLIRQLFAILVAAVLIGAPAAQAMIVMPCDTVAASATGHKPPNQAPTPCNEMTAGCADMLGCGLSAPLPANVTAAAHELIWIKAAYPAISDAHQGLSIEPDLGPPITI